MKKYIFLCFGALLQTLGNGKAHAMMGPLPSPYSSQTYQTNPASKMTPQQKAAVNQAFSWVQYTFQQNHTYRCHSREDCLNLDLGTLATFINSRSTHPARTLFQNIYNIIRQDARRQKFVTQWIVFKNLSQQRQTEYRNGIRIAPIQPQNVRALHGLTWIITPALFNQDDVFTDLLEQINHHHRNCEEYVTCLSGDLQIISALYSRLAPTDPVRTSLNRLSQTIKDLATRKIFNTSLYLILYNPLGMDWNNTLKKHKAKKIAAYGYAEWRQVEKSSRPVSWHSPRITNGTPLTQNQNFRPNVQDMKSTLQGSKQIGKEWWNKDKHLFREWW